MTCDSNAVSPLSLHEPIYFPVDASLGIHEVSCEGGPRIFIQIVTTKPKSP
jgi:hypothetical protein